MNRSRSHIAPLSLAALGALLLSLVAGPPTSRAHELRIRGEGELQADVRAAGTLLQVEGRLRDENGRPLPRRSISIEVLDDERDDVLYTDTTLTDRRGAFFYQSELHPGDFRVRASFSGTEHLDGDELISTLSARREPIELEIEVPRAVVGTDRPVLTRVSATMGEHGVRSRAEIYVNEQYVEDLELDGYGRGSIDLAPRLQPGDNSIEVLVPGTEYQSRKRARREVRLVVDPTFEAEAHLGYRRLQRGIVITGSLAGTEGPVPDVPVVATLSRLDGAAPDESTPTTGGGSPGARDGAGEGGLEPLYGRTDEEGRFRLFAGGRELRRGRWSARVIASPPVGPTLTATTAAVTFARTWSDHLLDILGVLAILVGVGLLVHRVGFTEVASWLQRRSEEREADEQPSLASFSEREELVPVQIEPPDDLGEVADDTSIGGVAWDSWRDEPIAGAELRLERDGEVLASSTTDARGRFSLDGAQGTYTLTASARGFVTATLSVELPHDGSLRFSRVSLVAVPLRIREFYQAFIREVQGEELWGRLSPAEIEEEVRAAFDAGGVEARLRERIEEAMRRLRDDPEAGPADLLRAITRVVEESYFSGRHYDERLWLSARRVILRLQRLLEPEEAR